MRCWGSDSPLPGCHSCHCPSFSPKSCASKITAKDGGCCSVSFGFAAVNSKDCKGFSDQGVVSPNTAVLTQADSLGLFAFPEHEILPVTH